MSFKVNLIVRAMNMQIHTMYIRYVKFIGKYYLLLTDENFIALNILGVKDCRFAGSFDQ